MTCLDVTNFFVVWYNLNNQLYSKQLSTKMLMIWECSPVFRFLSLLSTGLILKYPMGGEEGACHAVLGSERYMLSCGCIHISACIWPMCVSGHYSDGGIHLPDRDIWGHWRCCSCLRYLPGTSLTGGPQLSGGQAG